MTAAITFDYAADHYRRYPGECVTFFARVQVNEPIPQLMVQIQLPAGFTPTRHQAPDDEQRTDFIRVNEAQYVRWRVERELRPGQKLTYQLEGTIGPTRQDKTLTSTALAAIGDEARPARATVSVAVSARGRYLQHLPAIYQEDDELMGRFLMLFESFWAPIVGRIDDLPYYFDPRTMPADLLPWLATWVELTLDERWPEAKRRRLLQAAVGLYRTRGTRAGLQQYLEIYSDVTPHIAEHGAQNFRLGKEARLGGDVALGRLNQPHTFTVTLALPPVPGQAGAAERAQLEKERRRMIETIIEAEKPAHTAYNLNVVAGV